MPKKTGEQTVEQAISSQQQPFIDLPIRSKTYSCYSRGSIRETNVKTIDKAKLEIEALKHKSSVQ